MELFGNGETTREERLPLSRRMMPKTLDEFRGQEHLLADGKPISTMIANGILHSMIFYGPPATGKTSLAQIIANSMKARFVSTNALTLDNDAIRNILKEAEYRLREGVRTIVFIDEIHRLIRPKQDAFLSSLEYGTIVLIGATTENPYFILQPALRSRLFLYEFKMLGRPELETILDAALKSDSILSQIAVQLTKEARERLLEISADPRMMLNTLEMAVLSKGAAELILVTDADVNEILQKAENRYSSEEGHYEVISAFIKSVRGSAVDAALYYLALMLEGGEDPLFIARRLIILASEDVGVAYPEALPVAVACYDALERIGMPEGQLVLSETTILLAGAPKSNSALAINKAREDVRGGNVMKVPLYLRNATFAGEKDMGKGVGYKYPHSFPDHYVAEKYTEKPVSYYEPGDLGFENKIKSWLKYLKEKYGSKK